MRKPYITYNAINGEYCGHDTIEAARKFLKEESLDDNNEISEDVNHSAIYVLAERCKVVEIDNIENYTYQSEEDWPDDDMDYEDETWPFGNGHDSVGEIIFEPVHSVERGRVINVAMRMYRDVAGKGMASAQSQLRLLINELYPDFDFKINYENNNRNTK